jgi:hypothetical protein
MRGGQRAELAVHGLEGREVLLGASQHHGTLAGRDEHRGWGLSGHANTNAELVTAARAQIAGLKAAAGQ